MFDNNTIYFFEQVFAILGFSENKVPVTNAFIKSTLLYGLYFAEEAMDTTTKDSVHKELSSANSNEALERLFTTYVKKEKRSAIFALASQYAFIDILKLRGKPFSEEERQQILKITPKEILAYTNSLSSSQTQPNGRRV